jgi:hypothetical protein
MKYSLVLLALTFASNNDTAEGKGIFTDKNMLEYLDGWFPWIMPHHYSDQSKHVHDVD